LSIPYLLLPSAFNLQRCSAKPLFSLSLSSPSPLPKSPRFRKRMGPNRMAYLCAGLQSGRVQSPLTVPALLTAATLSGSTVRVASVDTFSSARQIPSGDVYVMAYM
jgi:hypothetical protein